MAVKKIISQQPLFHLHLVYAVMTAKGAKESLKNMTQKALKLQLALYL
jgi:hypothetical protein